MQASIPSPLNIPPSGVPPPPTLQLRWDLTPPHWSLSPKTPHSGSYPGTAPPRSVSSAPTPPQDPGGPLLSTGSQGTPPQHSPSCITAPPCQPLKAGSIPSPPTVTPSWPSTISTGCTDTLSMDLPYNNVHELVLSDSANKTRCDIDNGLIEVAFSYLPATRVFDDYRIDLYRSGLNVASILPPATDTLNLFAGLQAGNYSVIATDLIDGCASAAVTFNVVLVPTQPVVARSITKNAYCVGGSGTISLPIDGGQPATDYSFNWFAGPTTASPALPPANIVAPGDSVTALIAGQLYRHGNRYRYRVLPYQDLRHRRLHTHRGASPSPIWTSPTRMPACPPMEPTPS